MMKVSQYFYIFSKFTTSLILLLLVFILGYALYNSYQNVDKAHNNLDTSLLKFSEKINQNIDKLNTIENNLSLNRKSIDSINNVIDKKNNPKDSLKDKKEIKEILNLVNSLKEEIDILKSLLEKEDNKNKLDVSSNTQFNNQSLINLIILKYKDSHNIDSELDLLHSTMNLKDKGPIFEKLNILQSKKFIGLKELNNDFFLSRNKYVKSRFLKNNRNVVINFLMNFTDIKPNNLSIYEDKNLNVLLKAQNYLKSEDIEKTIEVLNQIDDSKIFFSDWFEQANLYIEFITEITKLI